MGGRRGSRARRSSKRGSFSSRRAVAAAVRRASASGAVSAVQCNAAAHTRSPNKQSNHHLHTLVHTHPHTLNQNQPVVAQLSTSGDTAHTSRTLAAASDTLAAPPLTPRSMHSNTWPPSTADTCFMAAVLLTVALPWLIAALTGSSSLLAALWLHATPPLVAAATAFAKARHGWNPGWVWRTAVDLSPAVATRKALWRQRSDSISTRYTTSARQAAASSGGGSPGHTPHRGAGGGGGGGSCEGSPLAASKRSSPVPGLNLTPVVQFTAGGGRGSSDNSPSEALSISRDRAIRPQLRPALSRSRSGHSPSHKESLTPGGGVSKMLARKGLAGV